MLYISEKEVKKLLNWDDTFEAVKTALESVARKHVVQDARGHTKWNQNSVLLTMPGYIKDSRFGALSCKLVTLCPNNQKFNPPLPAINANITLFDEETGLLKAIIGGVEITKWRTAAASAVATKFLTPKKDLEILAILGAGEQGQIHVEAFLHFFNFKEIRIWNHNRVKAEMMVSDLLKIYPKKNFKCYDSNEECVKEADVIVTATHSTSPIVQLEWLKKGVHINAVGVSSKPHSELADPIYKISEIYVDHMESAVHEVGDLQSMGVKFQGEIGSLITGELLPPSTDKITVFQSLGMAVEDSVMARLIYDLYNKQSGPNYCGGGKK